MTDFDFSVERKRTNSIKWDRYPGRDILPMWLADMDFQCPEPILDALRRRIDHGVLGYTYTPQELYDAVLNMLAEEYDWQVDPEWLVWLPGIVPGINAACRSFAAPDEEVITSLPTYHPFLDAPQISGRRLLTVPLVLDRGRYVMDFDELEHSITPRTKLLELCNPHNPVGRVYTREELTRLAEICLKHRLCISSDEIHCGLILEEGARHIPIGALAPEVAAHSITMMAPSKTYNIPGLCCAFAVIPNRELRQRMIGTMRGLVPFVNVLGYIAAAAAYRDCHEWHQGLIAYLRQNRDLLEQTVARIPGIGMTHIEATFLAWIDMRGLGLEYPAKYLEEFGLGVSDGRDFGQAGFIRINFACPRSRLKKALSILEDAVGQLAAAPSGEEVPLAH
ncbi:MAG: PatB family C-S lyase [Victivallales bacterium]|nr:PatB family C-S lyase [Victivallales bacterium]